MDKIELYNEMNSHIPLSHEEFIAAISSLEAKGLIETDSKECFIPRGCTVEITAPYFKTEVN